MVTGEDVTLEEMGGAEMHCRISGLGDMLVEDDEEAIAAIRVWLSYLPQNWEQQPPQVEPVEPAEGRTVREIVPERESEVFDMVELVKAIVDEDSFFPYKELFAPELLTGFARINGRPVGIVGNQPTHLGGVLFPDSSDKAARFIWICNAFNVPLLFLVDIAGYMIGSEVERQGIIRHGAKMLFAVADSRVPRITVLVRKAYGGGYLAMSGAPMHPDAVIALPTAKPALMGPDAAVNGIHYNKIQTHRGPGGARRLHQGEAGRVRRRHRRVQDRERERRRGGRPGERPACRAHRPIRHLPQASTGGTRAERRYHARLRFPGTQGRAESLSG